MKIFFVVGIGIALFIELLLVSKKNKSESDKTLTLWMFLILIHLFLFYISFTEDIYDFPFSLGISQPLLLLHGVFLVLLCCFCNKPTAGEQKRKGIGSTSAISFRMWKRSICAGCRS